ncbi:MAG: hypothetical protein ABSF00_00015 [Candidatus Bathyarchaeia archaeon]
MVPTGNIDALVSEWINDILFVAGKITEEELQEVMKTFEKTETSQEAAVVASEEDSDEDDEDDDDE